jgi:hypothetical protein
MSSVSGTRPSFERNPDSPPGGITQNFWAANLLPATVYSFADGRDATVCLAKIGLGQDIETFDWPGGMG